MEVLQRGALGTGGVSAGHRICSGVTQGPGTSLRRTSHSLCIQVPQQPTQPCSWGPRRRHTLGKKQGHQRQSPQLGKGTILASGKPRKLATWSGAGCSSSRQGVQLGQQSRIGMPASASARPVQDTALLAIVCPGSQHVHLGRRHQGRGDQPATWLRRRLHPPLTERPPP